MGQHQTASLALSFSVHQVKTNTFLCPDNDESPSSPGFSGLPGPFLKSPSPWVQRQRDLCSKSDSFPGEKPGNNSYLFSSSLFYLDTKLLSNLIVWINLILVSRLLQGSDSHQHLHRHHREKAGLCRSQMFMLATPSPPWASPTGPPATGLIHCRSADFHSSSIFY